MSLNGLLSTIIPTLPLISADKEVETLRMLPPETLFLALKDADTETALWAMENARVSQVQGVLDLDCWKGDAFLPERFFRYFEFMSYTTPEKLLEYMKDLDPEIIVLALMNVVEVTDFDPQNPPEVEESKMLLSPDSSYCLILKTEDPDLRERLFQWLNKLSAMDISLMRRHLESLKWENRSDLEEFGYQIKKGRIEELGFVEREEAVKFFSKISAGDLKRHLLENPLEKNVKEEYPLMETLGSEDFLPQPISKAVTDEGFFRKAIAHIQGAHLLDMLRMEVVRTVNAVFTAEDIMSAEVDTLKDSAARTRSYLDLGLLYLSGGDENVAAEMLKVQPLFEVSRLGWTLTQDLVRAAKEVITKYPLFLFDHIERDLLAALDGVHPQIQHPDVQRDLGLKDFKYFTLESLHKVADTVGALSVLGAFFQDTIGASLDGSSPYTEKESAWARLSTALFRQGSGREFSAKGITNAEWSELIPTWDAEKAKKILSLISEKVPAMGRPHFDKRMKEYFNEIEMLEIQKDIETKYSRTLRWV